MNKFNNIIIQYNDAKAPLILRLKEENTMILIGH